MFQFPVFLLLLGAPLLTSIPPTFGAGTKIEPDLKKKIDSAPVGSTWNIIILFKEDPKLLVPPSPKPSPEESHIPAYNSMLKLKKHAEESQSKVISEIKSFAAARAASASTKLSIQSHWCTKTVSVSSADRDLINLLGVEGKPEHENITKIVEDVPLEIGSDERIEVRQTGGNDLLDQAWGLKVIDAKTWWDAGFDGSGVIVGHIDDGVDINHPSLKYNWVGKGDGWRAPADKESILPYEMNPGSHGTHTLGIAIGRGNRKPGTNGTGNESDVNFYGVGVAPGARWMSCGNCDPNTRDKKNVSRCHTYLVADCLDFLYCPNSKNRCLYRPNVISISLGCRQNETHKCGYKGMLDHCIRALKSHSVITVFSAGNQGREGCQTIAEPADSEDIIAVGNVDERDWLAGDSSMGPPEWRYNETVWEDRALFKPDLVAPGTQILSTITSGPEGKFSYGYKSGTSMAAPHVAGAIALILSRTEGLPFEDVRGILGNSVVNNSQLRSYNPGYPCGGKPDTFFSNHKFGFGRLRMPDLNDPLMTVLFPKKTPTRKMPPPPEFSDALPRAVGPGMVGVVIMTASIGFLMDAALKI